MVQPQTRLDDWTLRASAGKWRSEEARDFARWPQLRRREALRFPLVELRESSLVLSREDLLEKILRKNLLWRSIWDHLRRDRLNLGGSEVKSWRGKVGCGEVKKWKRGDQLEFKVLDSAPKSLSSMVHLIFGWESPWRGPVNLHLDQVKVDSRLLQLHSQLSFWDFEPPPDHLFLPSKAWDSRPSHPILSPVVSPFLSPSRPPPSVSPPLLPS